MKGLQIWAWSKCRSVLAFYESLARAYGCPLRILYEVEDESRFDLGWDREEFSHLDIQMAASDMQGRLCQFHEHSDWAQWFSSYQSNPLARVLITYAKDMGLPVGVGSEAPSNGIKPSIRRLVKASPLYYARIRRSVQGVVRAADFIVNYSGDDDRGLIRLGWNKSKIIPFGYFPPPMQGSSFRARGIDDWKNFNLLVTGKMDWRRGQDIVVDALIELRKRGVTPLTVMTQEGELFEKISVKVRNAGLNVKLVGFADYSELLSLYRGCSAYIASGREEPWGMRINDALNCGAPLIVSSGMGGVKLVRDYGCGVEYDGRSSRSLAHAIERLMKNQGTYMDVVSRVGRAVAACSPEAKATELRHKLAMFKGWE